MSEDPETPKRTVFVRRDEQAPGRSEVPITPVPVTAPPAAAPTGGTGVRFGAVGSLVGATLNDNYEVTRYIAQGGMGEIYEGRQIRGNVKVAIKVILPQFAADPEFYKLLEREADLLATLGHDAIVKFRGLSHDPRSQLDYLTLEYVQGPSLEDKMGEGPIDPVSCRSLLRRLSSGLEAAHDKGVYHRDLSPDNILLRDGLIERATIIDFGIAKDADASKKTVIGAGFGGKLGYAAPEAFGLFGRDVGPWTDIYSLALVVAAAARGKAIDMGTASPIDAIQARQSVPALGDIEPWLATVLARMLEPDPADRLRSMADVIAAVDRLPPVGTPFEAARVSSREPKPVDPPVIKIERKAAENVPPVRQRSKLPLFIGGGVVLTAIAGGALLFSNAKSTPAAGASGRPGISTAPSDAEPAAPDWQSARAALASIHCSDIRAALPADGARSLAVTGWMATGTTIPASAGGFQIDGSAVKTLSPAPSAASCAAIDQLKTAAGDAGLTGSLQLPGVALWQVGQLQVDANGLRQLPIGFGALPKPVYIVAIDDAENDASKRIAAGQLPAGTPAIPFGGKRTRYLQFFVSGEPLPENGADTSNSAAVAAGVSRACANSCTSTSGWVVTQ